MKVPTACRHSDWSCHGYEGGSACRRGRLRRLPGCARLIYPPRERGISLPGRRALDKIKALPELDLEDGHRLTDAARKDRHGAKKMHFA